MQTGWRKAHPSLRRHATVQIVGWPTQTPADIYRHHPLFVSLRDSDALGGKCGRCEFRKICGGSRARAYGLTGDPFAADPSCSYQPALATA